MIQHLRTLVASIALTLVGLVALPAAAPAQAQSVLCFPENPVIRECIVSFRTYWQQNGGLQIFGYPISAEQPEHNPETGHTLVVQWFERNRFEAHPENSAPYDVLLGRLGADRLAELGRDWQAEGRERGPKSGCLWFAKTGHNVCDQDAYGATVADRGFKSYWLAEGLADPRLDAYQRSLALHGLPLTEARMETNSSGHTVLTQWFERGRFEWHPGNPPGARVLLGLLGNELRSSPAAQTLKWFWPRLVPPDLHVMLDGSFAADTLWMLQLAQPDALAPDVTIIGGVAGEPPGRNGRAVRVRGQRGMAYTIESGAVVRWFEDGQPYTISGTRSLQELLDIAEELQEVDRATWERELGWL